MNSTSTLSAIWLGKKRLKGAFSIFSTIVSTNTAWIGLDPFAARAVRKYIRIKRAKSKDLAVHGLRDEGVSRLFQTNLSERRSGAMTGHTNDSTPRALRSLPDQRRGGEDELTSGRRRCVDFALHQKAGCGP